MKKLGIAVTTVICIGLSALLAQAAAVHYSFNETAVGNWEVYVQVTGADTAGLSSYSLWVDAGAGVSYVENTLGTVGAGFVPKGFSPATLSSAYILGKFNVGNFQTFTAPILGIGKVPVDDPGVIPGTTPHVSLGVPALLGTLTTPADMGLGASNLTDFFPGDAGLFNEAGTGYLTSVPAATHEVNPIPEPVTLTLLGIGGLAMLIRRQR